MRRPGTSGAPGGAPRHHGRAASRPPPPQPRAIRDPARGGSAAWVRATSSSSRTVASVTVWSSACAASPPPQPAYRAWYAPRVSPLQVLAFVLGALAVARTLLSGIRTFVLPRGANDAMARLAFHGTRKLFNVVAGPRKPHAARPADGLLRAGLAGDPAGRLAGGGHGRLHTDVLLRPCGATAPALSPRRPCGATGAPTRRAPPLRRPLAASDSTVRPRHDRCRSCSIRALSGASGGPERTAGARGDRIVLPAHR